MNHAPSTQDNTLKDIIAQTSDEMVVFPKEDLTTNQVIDRLLQDIQQKAGDICYQIYQFLDCLSKSCDVITRQFEIIHNDLNKQK